MENVRHARDFTICRYHTHTNGDGCLPLFPKKNLRVWVAIFIPRSSPVSWQASEVRGRVLSPTIRAIITSVEKQGIYRVGVDHGRRAISGQKRLNLQIAPESFISSRRDKLHTSSNMRFVARSSSKTGHMVKGEVIDYVGI